MSDHIERACGLCGSLLHHDSQHTVIGTEDHSAQRSERLDSERSAKDNTLKRDQSPFSASPDTVKEQDEQPSLEVTRQAIIDALVKHQIIGARQAVDRLIAAAKAEERNAKTR